MASVTYSRKVTVLLACLLGLGTLFYFGTNQGVISRHQPVHDEDIEVAPVARSRPVERAESAAVLPVKHDSPHPDDVDANPVVVDRTTARVSIDEPLDLDADPVMLYSARLSGQQQNTGVFLDADGEPDELDSSAALPVQNTGVFLDMDAEADKQSSSEMTVSQNAGAFLDLDGNASDSHIDIDNEPLEVNTGEYQDLDGL